jgi:hypothetical protein
MNSIPEEVEENPKDIVLVNKSIEDILVLDTDTVEELAAIAYNIRNRVKTYISSIESAAIKRVSKTSLKELYIYFLGKTSEYTTQQYHNIISRYHTNLRVARSDTLIYQKLCEQIQEDLSIELNNSKTLNQKLLQEIKSLKQELSLCSDKRQ